MRVYCSEHAHSSVDKAVILLGLGHEALRKIPADDQFRMRADALRAAIADDRAAGVQPVAVVATIGTTSTTSVDPVAAIADDLRARGRLAARRRRLCRRGGDACRSTARTFDGWERADSIVVNPHKWLFTPFDLSAFYCRRMDVRAPGVLAGARVSARRPKATRGVRNLMDTGIQLGRRFRALKLWMVLRHFGAEGMRSALAEHMRLAQLFASGWTPIPTSSALAPVPFSVVCFRARPQRPADARRRARRASTSGCSMPSTRPARCSCRTRGCNDRFVAAPGRRPLRTTERHVARAWKLLKTHTAQLAAVTHS